MHHIGPKIAGLHPQDSTLQSTYNSSAADAASGYRWNAHRPELWTGGGGPSNSTPSNMSAFAGPITAIEVPALGAGRMVYCADSFSVLAIDTATGAVRQLLGGVRYPGTMMATSQPFAAPPPGSPSPSAAVGVWPPQGFFAGVSSSGGLWVSTSLMAPGTDPSGPLPQNFDAYRTPSGTIDIPVYRMSGVSGILVGGIDSVTSPIILVSQLRSVHAVVSVAGDLVAAPITDPANITLVLPFLYNASASSTVSYKPLLSALGTESWPSAVPGPNWPVSGSFGTQRVFFGPLQASLLGRKCSLPLLL